MHFELVKWLCVGSVPAAFAGVLLLRALGNGEGVQDVVKFALGVALLLAVDHDVRPRPARPAPARAGLALRPVGTGHRRLRRRSR